MRNLQMVTPKQRERERKKTRKKSLFFSKYHLGNNSHSSKTLQTFACIWNLIVTWGCLFYYRGKYCYNAKHQVLNWNLTALPCNDVGKKGDSISHIHRTLFPFLLFFKVKRSLLAISLSGEKKRNHVLLCLIFLLSLTLHQPTYTVSALAL